MNKNPFMMMAARVGTLSLFCVSFLSLAGSPAFSETFYVAPEGNDDNPGTLEAPLATLAGARNKVRTVLDGSGDITVYFRGGYYVLSETVVFGLQDSGASQQRITYRAYPGETPIFTSGKQVTGWTQIISSDPGFDFLPSSTREKVFVVDIPEGLGLLPTRICSSSRRTLRDMNSG